MSDSHESHEAHEADEALLPDDAEQRIGELLEALRESEERMMEGQSQEGGKATPATADPEPESESSAAESEELFEDFLSDEESDFVDLDAEMLDNSADMLELDERDYVEEMLQDEIEDYGTSSVATPDDKDIEEEVAVVLHKESVLIGQHAAPLTVPAPARPRDAMPQWLTPALAVIAVVLSASALWFTLNAPAPAAASATAAVERGDARALESLKVDLAALRERLSVVEGATAEGKEAVVVLERVQKIVTRMEQTILSNPTANATPAVESPATVVTRPQAVAPQPVPELEGQAELSTYVPTDEEVAVSFTPSTPSVTSPTNKVYVKGWAVNLRSFYHKGDAERLMQHYRQAGIDAELREIPKGDTTWYRVRVMGFGSKKEANAFIAGLSVEQGRDTAWPSYYQGYVDR